MAKTGLLFGVFLFAAPCLAGVVAEPGRISVPAVDVWSSPSAAGRASERETQLLEGDRVLVFESSGEWSHVQALDQLEFSHHQRWEGYPGWIRRDAWKPDESSTSRTFVAISPWAATPEGGYRPMGAWVTLSSTSPFFRPLNERPDNVRSSVLGNAEAFLGSPYLWGGLTAMPEDPVHSALVAENGIDCSGLVYVSYRTAGVLVPRDSLEQWMKAKRLRSAEALEPADLIFSASAKTPKKITHVTLFAGNGLIIEAPQTGMAVRKIPFREKYGADMTSLKSGDRVGDRVVYFGRLLP